MDLQSQWTSSELFVQHSEIPLLKFYVNIFHEGLLYNALWVHSSGIYNAL